MRMDEINASWISARLTGKRGEKSRLAEAMGIPLANLSKILSGDRKVQAEEIPSILRFFTPAGEAPDPLTTNRSAAEEKLVLAFREASPDVRAMMLRMVGQAEDRPPASPQPEK